MSHLAPRSPRWWRIDRVVGFVLALVGLGVAGIALIALQRPEGRQAGRETETTASSVPATATKSARSPSPRASSIPARATQPTPAVARTFPVIVLNNTAQAGAQDVAKQEFQTGGWTVSYVSTLDNQILSTCVYYDPAYPGAKAAAERLQQQFPAIKRVEPRFAELPAGPLVVVLTSDFAP